MSFQEKGLTVDKIPCLLTCWLLPLNLPICQQQKKRLNIVIMPIIIVSCVYIEFWKVVILLKMLTIV
jgi:hypothetical protein